MCKLFWQIFKYAVIGVLATVINLTVAELSAAYVLPCLGEDDFFVRVFGFPSAELSDVERANYAVVCNFVGFIVANVVCWMLNRRFVFVPGRHHWAVEYLLFLAGSAFAVLLGSAVIWFLVAYFAMETTYSFMINVFVSVSVNFVVRKFLVFKE